MLVTTSYPRPRRAAGRMSFWVLLVILAACGGNPGDEGLAPEERTTVRVQNQAWTDMTVYAVANGQRVRLGNVTGSSTAVFRIPASIVGFGRSLTFVVDPLGSNRTSRSFEIVVRPGDEVSLIIPPQAG